MSSSPRILFVDDEERVLQALRRHFLDDDYEILTAPSAYEGLAILAESPVQVVVSDFRMPEMNGGEFLRQVSEQWPETTRIVLSGYADISAVIAAINDGAIFKFISKPWQDAELKDTIREGVERYHSMTDMRKLAEQALAANQGIFEDESERWCELGRRNLELEADRRSLATIRDAFLSTAAGILIFDLTGTVLESNPTARLMFSDPDTDTNEGNDALVFPHDLLEDVQHVLVDDHTISRQYRIDRSNGTLFFASLAPLCGNAVDRGVVAVVVRVE